MTSLANKTSTAAGYPLAALVGQFKMIEALKMLAVDPSIGGLLLVGEKGTAKSTAARALAELLPLEEIAGSCPYNCPADQPDLFCPSCRFAYENGAAGSLKTMLPAFRTVPLGVTEDRLLGGLDWEKTIHEGRPYIRPGLLGEANGGLLYIDEVNLLEPSLAHLLLDAVSAGRVILERDGLSASYPARVTLLATMNPEEGDLGPQLADRFALTVHLVGEADGAMRAEVIKRRLAFEKDPSGFRNNYQAASEELAKAIAAARKLFPNIGYQDEARRLMAGLAAAHRLAGHRGDLALAKAARAKAALLGLETVSTREVEEVADLVLPSRTRPAPPKKSVTVPVELIEKAGHKEKLFEPVYVPDMPETPPEYNAGGDEDPEEPDVLKIFKSGDTFNLATPQKKREVGPRGRSGRRSTRETAKAIGRSYRTTARRLGRPLSLSATLRAAAPYQITRKTESEFRPLILKPDDFREKVYRQKTGRLVVFVVDSSGSIGTLYRMEAAKAAVLSLLAEAYQKRDRVALIAFYGQKAEMLLPPTNSPDLAGRMLSELPSGGKTPLPAALVMTGRLLRVEMAKDPAISPYVVLMTDGRPNIPLERTANPWAETLSLAEQLSANPKINFLLIDTDRGAYNEYKLTRDLSLKLRAPRINLDELQEGRLEAWLAEGGCG